MTRTNRMTCENCGDNCEFEDDGNDGCLCELVACLGCGFDCSRGEQL